jgi:hypothetical protein
MIYSQTLTACHISLHGIRWYIRFGSEQAKALQAAKSKGQFKTLEEVDAHLR